MLAADATVAGLRRLPLVLLVEDHQDTRQMYAEFLSGEFEVATAPDGAEALDLMRRRRPDLIITDLSLPGIDGFALIARIRQDAAVATIPIICLSGYGGHAYEERARHAGCDRLLQKPFTPDALADVATELLQVERRIKS
jgi:two-component system, chemotaxis family, CheB/CheR fusion protein